MLPTWLCHRSRNAVFDGDHVFLHILERIMAGKLAQGQTWRKAYYMPTQSDRCCCFPPNPQIACT